MNADGAVFFCPECTHEWSPAHAAAPAEAEPESVVRDANGSVLKDGDNVVVVKDLPP